MINKIQNAIRLVFVSLALTAMLATTAQAAGHADKSMAKQNHALEMQLNKMAKMMKKMQAQIKRLQKSSSSASTKSKVRRLDKWMASVKRSGGKMGAAKDHAFSVRGGWASMEETRGSSTLFGLSDDFLTSQTDEDAFYYGGVIDFNINNDLFGLMDHTSFGIEFGVEYSEIGDGNRNNLYDIVKNTADYGTVADALGLPAGSTREADAKAALAGIPQQSVTVNMLRIGAAPKIKFNHGGKFRPWIIPLGLDINIISPPSDAVTVLNTGMQFGGGVEYNLFREVLIGADVRYHWTPDDVDGVNTDGVTLGGSVGFKF